MFLMYVQTSQTGSSINAREEYTELVVSLYQPVLEDDLPLHLAPLHALPLVGQCGGGDLQREGVARFKPGAKPGRGEVTGS